MLSPAEIQYLGDVSKSLSWLFGLLAFFIVAVSDGWNKFSFFVFTAFVAVAIILPGKHETEKLLSSYSTHCVCQPVQQKATVPNKAGKASSTDVPPHKPAPPPKS